MIKPYFKNEKKLFEVFVKSKDINGKQAAKRKRGILTALQAREIEFEFKFDLAQVYDLKQRANS